MHAINLAILLPGFLATMWIWPALRRPSIWMAIGLVTLTYTVVWLGLDFREDLRLGHPMDRLPRRIIFKIISHDIPVVQLGIGSLIATICSWFWRVKPEASKPVDVYQSDKNDLEK